MKLPRKQMMTARSEFQLVKTKGHSRVGKYMILSALQADLPAHKFAFITSKKVGKAHQRNFVRRRFRDLLSRHGDQLRETGYLVLIGRYSAPHCSFADFEKEFLTLARKLRLMDSDS